MDAEVNSRINKASAAFCRIRKTVLFSHNLRLLTKVAVYRAVCLSVLLYGCETLTLYRKHVKLLEAFHMRCIKAILGLTWKDKVPHAEMLTRTGLQSIESMLLRIQLRWVGHVCRMPSERYPRRVLYGQLAEGTRPAHGPKKRYKDHIKKTMKSFGIDPATLESSSSDRSTWRSMCHDGAMTFEANRAEKRREKRLRRHTGERERQLREPNQDHRCPECGRACASALGLMSHRRTHQRDPARGRHVIIGNDGQP